jgi:hypothetical protein
MKHKKGRTKRDRERKLTQPVLGGDIIAAAKGAGREEALRIPGPLSQ